MTYPRASFCTTGSSTSFIGKDNLSGKFVIAEDTIPYLYIAEVKDVGIDMIPFKKTNELSDALFFNSIEEARKYYNKNIAIYNKDKSQYYDILLIRYSAVPVYDIN